MSDGKIEYELSIETRAAVSGVAGAKTATDALADSMGKVSRASGEASRAMQSISGEKIKTIAGMIGAAGLELGALALKSGGYDKAAGYLASAGQGAMQLGLTGAMVGGAPGAAIGTAAGAVLGAGKQFFSNQIADISAMEAEAKLYANMQVSAEAANRAIASIKTPKELQAAISAIDEKLAGISRSAEFGLIPGNIAARMTRDLTAQRGLASSLIPGATAAEGQRNAEANAALILKETTGFQQGREANAFNISLDSAATAAEKIALIDARMRKLRDTAAELADKIDPAGPTEAVAAILSSISSVESELNSLTSARAAVKDPKALADRMGSVETDRLTRVGGVMGGIGAATSDYARATSGNTAKLVALTERLVNKSDRSGGSTWAA